MKNALIIIMILFAGFVIADDCGNPVELEGTYYMSLTTHNISGFSMDADSVPTYRVYEQNIPDAIETGSMYLLDATNTDGFYGVNISADAASGYEVGKKYNVYVTATVDSVAGTTVREFCVLTQTMENTFNNVTRIVANQTTLNANILTRGTSTLTTSDNIGINLDDTAGTLDAAEIGTNAITADKIAAAVITSSEAPNLDAAISTRSTLVATDNIGINWADVENPTTTVGLTGTTIGTTTNVTNIINAVRVNATLETEINKIQTVLSNVTQIMYNQSTINANVLTRGTSTLTASDNIGINWADISNPTTAQNLTGTTIGTVTTTVSTGSAVVVGTIGVNSTLEAQIMKISAGFSNVTANQTTINTNVQSKGISNLTAAQVDAQLNTSHGTGTWTTATGFATTANITSLYGNMSTINANILLALTNQTRIYTLIVTKSNLTAAEVWASATRTLSAFAFTVGLNTTLESTLNTRGISNLTTSNLDTYCASPAEVTADHGTGLYNFTASQMNITSEAVNNVANTTFRKIAQNRNETYTYNSSYYLLYETGRYADGTVVNATYGYNGTMLNNKSYRVN